MNPAPFTLEEFVYILRLLVSADTSSDPERWTRENPLWGHCAVVALIVQDYFGGDLLRAPLHQLPEFALMGSHYWNRLPDGREVDLTHEQFGRDISAELKPLAERRYRNYVLNCPETKMRYELLRSRLDKILAGEDPFCVSL